MRREGFQHGMIRNTKAITASDFYTKAPSKPTGHSRYTGKCKKARCVHCHSHPVSKSRDKAKGMYKLKSGDVVLNHRLMSWRVVADKNEHWSKYAGASASGILDALLSESCMSEEDYDHEIQNNGYEVGFREPPDGFLTGNQDTKEEHAEEIEEVEEEKEDDDMGFYEVGFVWEYMDEDGWCVVDEM